MSETVLPAMSTDTLTAPEAQVKRRSRVPMLRYRPKLIEKVNDPSGRPETSFEVPSDSAIAGHRETSQENDIEEKPEKPNIPGYHLTGTSGYSYEHWQSLIFKNQPFEGFYPPHISKNQMFEYYAQHFNFVEINNTFYGNPTEQTVKNWYDNSPADFRFLVKANKFITHSKKLLDFEETFTRAMNLYTHLKEKCVGILLQLPPTFQNNAKNFERVKQCGLFQKTMNNPYNYQVFIEFRHPSWFAPSEFRSTLKELDKPGWPVYEMLREIGWSMTIVYLNNDCNSFGDMRSGMSPSYEEVVDGSAITVPDTIMFRCHGTFSFQPYMGGYSDEQLVAMASVASSKRRGLIAFDNTDSWQYQLDFPWFSTPQKTHKLVFSPQLAIDKPKRLLPHAVADALKVKSLLS